MKNKSQLCWNCKNCNDNCCWIRELKPVNGWKAKKTTIINRYKKNTIKETNSYQIMKCPDFIIENPVKLSNREICKILKVSERNFYRNKNMYLKIYKGLNNKNTINISSMEQ